MNKTILQFLLILFTLTACANYAAANPDIYKDISYVSSSNLDLQKLDIYVPKNANAQNRLPVHIFVHGGGWSFGDKKRTTLKKARAYTDQGIILVSINYRLSPKHTHPAHIKDCASAVKWVVKHINEYGGDQKNMVLSGHSAGAHLVALLGTNAQYLKAKDLPLNIFKAVIPVDTATFNMTEKQKGGLNRLIQRWRDNAFGTKLETLIEASPLLQIKKDIELSPFLIFATAKREDAVEQSKIFESTLKKNNHTAQTIIMDKSYSHLDIGHAIFDPTSKLFKKITAILQN